MKAVAATLGVARSNLVEQLQRPKRPQRGPYRRAEDEAVLGEIRTITDARPTYGYRRVAALLNRAMRNAGAPQINHKRVFRLMRLSSMLLKPHTGNLAIADTLDWDDGNYATRRPCAGSTYCAGYIISIDGSVRIAAWAGSSPS